MQNPETNARQALYKAGWYKSFGSVIGDYWSNEKEEYILKGSALEAFTTLCEVNALPPNHE
jgi:hypothetical protein